ncbi:MAG: D-alanine--D-alanine ligase [Clostridiales bacterium]|jgi:D-alanine-D-alanine ligase|nr:D-alanine--D-alanine ligase [Clostridiales bacterium]
MKIRVGVFFGGQSVEHEVSVISGIQALNSIDRDVYEPIPIYISRESQMFVGADVGDISSYKNIKELLSKSQRILLCNTGNKVEMLRHPPKRFSSNFLGSLDIAFPVVHGTNVEDGSLQGYFRSIPIPFVGCDCLASACCMDKYMMKAILKDNDIPVLDCVQFDSSQYAQDDGKLIPSIMEKIGFPCIVKPTDLGSSVGIKKAKDPESLAEAIDYALQFSQRALVERAVTNLREINCAVLGDYENARASECEEPIGTDEILSYENKYGGGSKGMAGTQRKLPADITPEQREKIRDLAVKAFKSLNCNGVVRIDFLMEGSTGEIWLNEINTIPGSLSFYLWEPVGLKYPKLLDEMIKLGLKREREKANLSFSIDTSILANANIGIKGGSKGFVKR